jgi:hypothetical protein
MNVPQAHAQVSLAPAPLCSRRVYDFVVDVEIGPMPVYPFASLFGLLEGGPSSSLILNWCIGGCWFTPALMAGGGPRANKKTGSLKLHTTCLSFFWHSRKYPASKKNYIQCTEPAPI